MIGYYSTSLEPIRYPLTVVEYHHRWYGGPLLRLSKWLRDLAYWQARRVETTISTGPDLMETETVAGGPVFCWPSQGAKP